MRFCVAILSRILSEPVDSKALIVSVNSSGEEVYLPLIPSGRLEIAGLVIISLSIISIYVSGM